MGPAILDEDLHLVDQTYRSFLLATRILLLPRGLKTSDPPLIEPRCVAISADESELLLKSTKAVSSQGSLSKLYMGFLTFNKFYSKVSST